MSLAIGIDLGTIILFFTHGAWGWVGVGVTIPAFLLAIWHGDARLYRRIVRPRIASLVSETGATVSEVLASLKDITKAGDDIGRFDVELEDDGALEVLVHLREVARLNEPT